jgi:hypothetical protein
MRERADDVRNEAAVLAERAGSVAWTGVAADATRRVLGEHTARMRGCAEAHDRAADALDRHARVVDHLEEEIALVERRALGLLDSATRGLSGLIGHLVPHSLADWARHFDPPPHGSREWLDVRLPGAA